MTKAVHLTSVHNPNDPRIFHKECKSLAQAGYEVVLVAPTSGDDMVDGVRLRAVPEPASRLERMRRTVRHVCQAAIDEDADVYHIHDPELIRCGRRLTRLGKPVIYDVHEDYVTSIRQKRYIPNLMRNPMAIVAGRLENSATKAFHIILAERYYAARFPNGLTVLNYPVQELFPTQVARGPAHNLLYTGTVGVDRGALLHARIVALIDNVQVHIVGRCPEEVADLMEQAAGSGRARLHVEGAGYRVPYERILESYWQGTWLAGLAIFPDTPHYVDKELTKLFEYMGAGIPIVCSNFPKWQALIEETGAGLCVDPGSEESIVGAIRYLQSHPDKADEMGRNGRSAFLERYNWQHEANKLLQLYSDLSN